jgi:Amt family ammonium transporter
MVQLISQCKAWRLPLVWSGVGSLIIYKVVDVLVDCARSRGRREGLDITDHGERAYTM